MDDLILFIGVLVVLFIAWLTIGGPSREEAQDKFIRQPNGFGTGETYDEKLFERDALFDGFGRNNDE